MQHWEERVAVERKIRELKKEITALEGHLGCIEHNRKVDIEFSAKYWTAWWDRATKRPGVFERVEHRADWNVVTDEDRAKWLIPRA